MPYPFDCITKFMFFETAIEPSDVILLPGGSHPQLMERAAELYHQGLAPCILPLGGTTRSVSSTEWEFLRDVGLSLGVPERSILREDQATNTFENARYSWKTLQQQRINPRKAILVFKSYFARRALLTYQVEFPSEVEFFVSPVTDKTGTTKDNWYLDERKINYVMNELTKVGQYFKHHIPNWVNSKQ
ncbi:YdcF family protein [Paenibacillus dokdonensis]|uniref:YdcF family protein n=1 Tax=Paenibacillus dokdonensis TaxID=2567944 RepID=A0ABU6GKL9_9BACL|nr:YdcF family protein [Paenibacillus dokdonensis]MEC0240291.1 YdcF family protein [Paenibacillus dokdonensis]